MGNNDDLANPLDSVCAPSCCILQGNNFSTICDSKDKYTIPVPTVFEKLLFEKVARLIQYTCDCNPEYSVEAFDWECPNSSLQDWHTFALDKEPWFVFLLVYNRNEYSINYGMLHDNALLLLCVVLTRVLAPPGLCVQWLVSRCWLIILVLTCLAPLLLLLVVLTHVLAPLARLLQWPVSRCRLIALVLARLSPLLLLFVVLTRVLAPLPPAPLLLLLVVLTRVLACLAPLLLLLVVLTRVLAPLARLLQWFVSWCWLVIALVLARLAPLLLLLVVLTRVLALPAPLLLLFVVLTRVLARLAPCLLLLVVLTRVLAPPAPFLLLFVVLTRVLAPPDLCVQWLVSRCQLIACSCTPSSSIAAACCSDSCSRTAWFVRALRRCTLSDDAVDKEPSLLVYNRNEDSFNHAMSIITHCQMKKRMYNNNK